MEWVFNKTYLAFLQLIQALSWILGLPLRIIASVISTIRMRRYDPRKVVMPCCGFRGDSGSGGDSCTVMFREVMGADKGAIQHTCLRCGCDKYYTRLVYPADKWFPSTAIDHLKEAAKRTVI